MISAAVASLLLVAAAQNPAADAATDKPPESHEAGLTLEEEQALDDAADALEAADQTAEEAAEEVVEAAEAAGTGGAAEIGEEEDARICRRQSYYDDFGRQRSRKSCRPRD